MRFRIVQVENGRWRMLGSVEAVNASVAILLGMRKYPQPRRADGSHAMLVTEKVAAI